MGQMPVVFVVMAEQPHARGTVFTAFDSEDKANAEAAGYVAGWATEMLGHGGWHDVCGSNWEAKLSDLRDMKDGAGGCDCQVMQLAVC